MTPHEFLDFVFADRTDDEVICVSKGSPQENGDTLFWNVAPEHDVFTGWTERLTRKREAWYFCVSTVNGTLNEKETALRRRRADLVRYHCLVLDDIGTKALAPPVEPAWKLESSEGNYQWGYLIEPGDDWEGYEALLEWAHEQGWGDGGAGGSYRVMRVPFSANLKPGKDRFLAQIEIVDDVVWELGDLARELGLDLETWDKYRKPVSKSVQRVTGGAQRVTGGASVNDNDIEDPMLTWLADNGHVTKDDGGDFVDIVCPWHEEHTTGAITASYSPLGRGVNGWEETRAFSCFHEHCKDRGIRDLVGWAVPEGGPWVSGNDPLPWLQQRYVYVEEGRSVADMYQRPLGGYWRMDLEEWSNRHYRRVDLPNHDRPVLLKNAFIESRDTQRAARFAYAPGQDGVAELCGQNVLNTYVEPQHPETHTEPKVFLDHIDFLCGEYADLFLDWLAFKIQHPQKRSYAVVMVADEAYGTGRSWLRQMLTEALEGKVETASLGQLIGKGTSAEQTYNDWAAECQFVVVEEARENLSTQDVYHGYQTFKQRVDTRVVSFRCNPKYGKTREDFMFFNALIFTNHADALVLPENDRRICVIKNPSERRNWLYYETLEQHLKGDEPGCVYWYLKHRDISQFDHVYPPMTEGKRAMIEQARSPYDEAVDWVRDRLPGDIVTRSTLAMKFKRAVIDLELDSLERNIGTHIGRFWKSLGKLRDTKNGARYYVHGKQVEVRPVREKDFWRGVDEARDDDDNGAKIVDEALKNESNVVEFPQSPSVSEEK